MVLMYRLTYIQFLKLRWQMVPQCKTMSIINIFIRTSKVALATVGALSLVREKG
jgi:hypothetical protein